ncbi:alanine racemase [Aliifodinibius sp. S!AR15-10]|uniref:alanine racemase n=1 Tax=Aliifodinibius sp. S!AR15-10 TaxID=2950437 RepID=UPI0028556772|nr:alanine racemase [Aliifodinibius sp. S!AR15-10]MDR8391619.1 alanine racemase [Aliifodinibius sp. S!AR15-10]
MISNPTLLLDEKRCKANISRIAQKSATHNLTFKPHFKTHQSILVGNWFREFGVKAITVSSVQMAHKFADDGWDDITIAFPVNIRAINEINELTKKVDSLSLFVLDSNTVAFLDQHLSTPVQIYIEIDTGASRSGLVPGDSNTIASIAGQIDSSDKLTFKGFYSHPGHSYRARSRQEILQVHHSVLSDMKSLKKHFPDVVCCVGDTPCASLAEDFEAIDEISPGNFVFYDLMQVQIGACSLEDIAVALDVPVVAKYPARRELIIHGGAVHLSKEQIEWNGQQIFGLPVPLTETSWSEPYENTYVKSLSQEHGVIRGDTDLIDSIEIGDLIGILPVHSCLTANLMQTYSILS